MFVNSCLVVVLAELDYRQNYLEFDGSSFFRSSTTIRVDEIQQLDWQNGVFPQTDNGGCRIRSGSKTLTVRFQYLEDETALELIRTIRRLVRKCCQRNWTQFCELTAYRILMQVRHPETSLSQLEVEHSSTVDPQHSTDRRRVIQLLTVALLSVPGLFALLTNIGISFEIAIACSIALFVFVRVMIQLCTTSKNAPSNTKANKRLALWERECMTH